MNPPSRCAPSSDAKRGAYGRQAGSTVALAWARLMRGPAPAGMWH
ncbi:MULTISPECIES: hypothetical protein [unclassified Acidovorax]|nr:MULTISPECIES: hypothetical protein [unclassified Acidovorax]